MPDTKRIDDDVNKFRRLFVIMELRRLTPFEADEITTLNMIYNPDRSSYPQRLCKPSTTGVYFANN